MSIRWLKMGKLSDKMRQDVAKMRKMTDVSSVLGPRGGHEARITNNTTVGRGAGESPP